MLPISDENPTKRFPIVTVLLILANLAVFFAWQMQVGLPKSVALAGLVPTELHPLSVRGVEHLFTSMFMHGGIAHLLGNMWFLWIFGDNVEDEIGRIKFVFFYLLSGGAGAAAHVALNAKSGIPMVGASGAISGVLGAYLLLHPSARVKGFASSKSRLGPISSSGSGCKSSPCRKPANSRAWASPTGRTSADSWPECSSRSSSPRASSPRIFDPNQPKQPTHLANKMNFAVARASKLHVRP